MLAHFGYLISGRPAKGDEKFTWIFKVKNLLVPAFDDGDELFKGWNPLTKFWGTLTIMGHLLIRFKSMLFQ